MNEVRWDGTHYTYPPEGVSLPGQRPITAFVGAEGSDIYVQFVEREENLIGTVLYNVEIEYLFFCCFV